MSGTTSTSWVSYVPNEVTSTPPPTSKSSTDFVYVEYSDYNEFLAYDNAPPLSETPPPVPATTAITTTTAGITAELIFLTHMQNHSRTQ
ncbi:hypothetical protein GOODEAATRI_031101, partial [Goodea atripinnis]